MPLATNYGFFYCFKLRWGEAPAHLIIGQDFSEFLTGCILYIAPGPRGLGSEARPLQQIINGIELRSLPIQATCLVQSLRRLRCVPGDNIARLRIRDQIVYPPALSEPSPLLPGCPYP
ncbi:hypothetical protein BCH_01520 [Brucella sp. 191011898]|nr:hypothetical protein BCH_01520 [Brucella sp. 191011898]